MFSLASPPATPGVEREVRGTMGRVTRGWRRALGLPDPRNEELALLLAQGLTPEDIASLRSQFEPEWYTHEYQDVSEHFADPLVHFMVYGWKEGRRPADWFDPCAYLEANPDVAICEMNPFLHWVVSGRDEDRPLKPRAATDGPVPFEGLTPDEIAVLRSHFDAAWYTREYPDVSGHFADPFDHYIAYGWREGRWPVAWFDSAAYLQANPDVASRKMNPFLHWLIAGRDEGRPMRPEGRSGGVSAAQETAGEGATTANLSEASVNPPDYMVTLRGRNLSTVALETKLELPTDPMASVVVPVHGRADLTLELMHSLARSETDFPFEVVIVDDASAEEDAAILRSIPGVSHVRLDENIGFAGACNAGAAAARADLLFFVNSDIQVHPAYLQTLVDVATSHDSFGAISGLLLNFDGTLQEAGGRLLADGRTELLRFGETPIEPASSADVEEVDYVSAAAMLTPRAVFEQLGGFDLAFGRGFYEDTDYCVKLRSQLNLPCLVATAARAVHHLSGSMLSSSQTAKVALSERNRQTFLGRWADRLDSNGVRAVALHLPQFHRIRENDEWWGPGFTEWTNVSRARPLYSGHVQPKIPADLGFYSLDSETALRSQAALARRYGVSAFCFYYYSFEGRNPLGKPLELFRNTPDIDIEFCLAWANEPWSRNWDGGDREVLLPQTMSDEEVILAAEGMVPYLKDSRYMRVCDRPVVLVYRAQLAPNPLRTVGLIRNVFRESIGVVHLVAMESFELAHAPVDPRRWGFDASVEFPPHQLGFAGANAPEFVAEFTGHAFDYARMVDEVKRKRRPAWHRYPAVTPRWDNTPRQLSGSTVFYGSTPEVFADWVSWASREAARRLPPAERLVFINAWNEWGEGAHLEPDQEWGHGYLEALAYGLESYQWE